MKVMKSLLTTNPALSLATGFINPSRQYSYAWNFLLRKIKANSEIFACIKMRSMKTYKIIDYDMISV